MGIFDAMQSPLFLGGVGMMSGGGMQAMQQGMQSGIMAQKDRRETEQYERQLQQQQARAAQLAQWQAQPPAWASKLPPGILPLAGLNPEAAPQMLGNAIIKHPELELERQKAAAQIEMMRAHTGLYGAQADKERSGGDRPMPAKEWDFFSRLPPEDQQKYMLMKRAAPKALDTGTEFVVPSVLDPTAAPTPIARKDNAGKAYDQEQGKAAGKSAAALPSVISSTNRILGSIDAVINDKGLSNVTDLVGGRIPKYLQTPGMAETQSRLDQLHGQTFMQAFNELRGAGQISNQEGAKAEAAYNRLRTQTMGTAAYIEAAKEFRSDVLRMAAIAKERAQRPGSAPAAQPSAPAPSDGWSIQKVQ